MTSRATTIEYPTDAGAQPARLVTPPGGRHPSGAILFVHENKGLTPYMCDVMDELADQGWLVVAPDLMARLGEDGDDDEVTTRLIPMDRHIADIRSALDALERRAEGMPVGMVGFCFGGEAALEAARGRSELSVLVAWYGVPPEEVSDLPDPVLVLLAAEDDRVNRHTESFMQQLEETGKDYVIQSYPETLHAFHDWSRPERHAPRAAATAWEECRHFLRSHLV